MSEAMIIETEIHLTEEALRRQSLRVQRSVRILPTDATPIDISFPHPAPPSKAERERAAFLRLLPVLMATHAGRYVAVHGEEIVDADADDIALVRRVHARFGYVPIYVGLVTAIPLVVRVPGFREVRPRGETA